MNIAVFGAGKVGGTLANLWASAGHRIWVGARDPQSEKTRAFAESAHPGITVTTVMDAAAQASVILLATTWDQGEHALQAAGDLTGKILIDATNPLGPQGKVIFGPEISAAEQVARWTGARVVKAFSTTGVANMANPKMNGMQVDMYYCGDDAEAKQLVNGLICDIGLEPVDCGPLFMARSLESLAGLWVHLAYYEGYGPDFMFKLVRRS